MSLLKIENMTVSYKNNPVPSVESFNLTLQPGEVVSIVGESGSGKTTVIRSILGLLPGGGKIQHGEILFEERSLLNLSPLEWKALRGSEISMIFQDSGAMINPIRRVGDQFVEYILTHKKMTKKDAWQMGVTMMKNMRLPDGERVMRSYPFQLSGGMRQRVGIAMAMTFQPKLMLADEPTSALDVTTQAQIVRQFMELKETFNTAMIVVTHNIGVAAYMADQLIVMQNGKVVDAGSRDQVMLRPTSDYTKNLLQAVPEMEGKRYV